MTGKRRTTQCKLKLNIAFNLLGQGDPVQATVSFKFAPGQSSPSGSAGPGIQVRVHSSTPIPEQGALQETLRDQADHWLGTIDKGVFILHYLSGLLINWKVL